MTLVQHTRVNPADRCDVCLGYGYIPDHDNPMATLPCLFCHGKATWQWRRQVAERKDLNRLIRKLGRVALWVIIIFLAVWCFRPLPAAQAAAYNGSRWDGVLAGLLLLKGILFVIRAEHRAREGRK